MAITRRERYLNQKLKHETIEQIRYIAPGALVSDIHVRAKLCRMNTHASMLAIAKIIGVSRQHVWNVINGKCRPGRKVLSYFKLEKVDLYRRVPDGETP